MPPPLDDIADAFADAVLDALMDQQEAHVPGLGTFSVVQHDSRATTDAEGRPIIEPPHRTIQFTPER